MVSDPKPTPIKSHHRPVALSAVVVSVSAAKGTSNAANSWRDWGRVLLELLGSSDQRVRWSAADSFVLIKQTCGCDGRFVRALCSMIDEGDVETCVAAADAVSRTASYLNDDQFVGHAIGEVILRRISGEVFKWQYCEGLNAGRLAGRYIWMITRSLDRSNKAVATPG